MEGETLTLPSPASLPSVHGEPWEVQSSPVSAWAIEKFVGLCLSLNKRAGLPSRILQLRHSAVLSIDHPPTAPLLEGQSEKLWGQWEPWKEYDHSKSQFRSVLWDKWIALFICQIKCRMSA